MKKTAWIYIIYGFACSVIAIIYAHLIGPMPSVGLVTVLALFLLGSGIKHLIKDENEENLTREAITTMAALSPGLVNITKIYRKDGESIQLAIGIIMLSAFLVSIGFFGSLLMTDIAKSIEPGFGLLLIALGILTILFDYDISLTFANRYCDGLDLPYGGGKFEIECNDTQHDAVKSFVFYIAISSVAVAIYMISRLV